MTELKPRSGVTNREEAEAVLARYPLPRIKARYAADYDVPPELAERVVEEMKRFLALCAIHPSAHYGMRGIVDDAWHTFMIFSREYTQFCEELASGYIHHEPEESGPEETATSRLAEGRSSYLTTLQNYEAVFGETPSPDIWPQIVTKSEFAASCRNGCGRSCSRCGRGCSSCGHGCRGCNRCGPH